MEGRSGGKWWWGCKLVFRLSTLGVSHHGKAGALVNICAWRGSEQGQGGGSRSWGSTARLQITSSTHACYTHTRSGVTDLRQGLDIWHMGITEELTYKVGKMPLFFSEFICYRGIRERSWEAQCASFRPRFTTTQWWQFLFLPSGQMTIGFPTFLIFYKIKYKIELQVRKSNVGNLGHFLYISEPSLSSASLTRAFSKQFFFALLKLHWRRWIRCCLSMRLILLGISARDTFHHGLDASCLLLSWIRPWVISMQLECLRMKVVVSCVPSMY